ncbi:hypothetical protein ACKUB1_13700 [Methanospirillum stamsii]|uniref:Uncharacterized protein n=1 Tax=Methanospirillum stamsii TaxID=1277351 RepID=A0A2V2NEJ2_9EURY|nr:hypothetical protein [Methanospirillum stamsii]PWR74838.1 hypothetical protein DLD82_08040 [Methanospirillum stamsii]
MTEAAAVPQQERPRVTDQVKIAYLDRGRCMVRLIFLTGFDKDHNLEYSYKNADVDPDIRTNDAPVNCVRQGERLISLQFPPDQKPVTSAPTQNPVSQAKAAEQPAKPPAEKPKQEEKPAEQKPTAPPVDDGKYKIQLIRRDGNKALIRTNNGKEEWFSVSGKAVEKISNLKDGQLVKLRFETSTTFNDINPVDENGEYDKSGWGGGGNKGGKGGGGYRQDPVIDLIRNYSILHEAVLDKAEKFAEFCIANDVTDEKRGKSWDWILETTIVSSETIYRKIEEKYKYQGGQQ